MQYLDGDTAVGPNSVIPGRFRMTCRAAFLRSSWEWRQERVTLRFDDFRTHQTSGFFGPPSDDVGHAWTLGCTHDFGKDFQVTAEGTRVTSRFPPRATIGESVGPVESQLQLAFRYRFYWPDFD